MIHISRCTHIAFADETKYNEDRYRGVALITLKQRHVNELRAELQAALVDSSVREFKWEKLRNAKYQFAALKLIDCAISKAIQGVIRVDALTWDIEDGRHKIKGRDDIANLHRMYYHLFKNVLTERWPGSGIWRLHPDEQAAMNWAETKDFLVSVSIQPDSERDLFTLERFGLRFKRVFNIEEVVPSKSHKEPMVQLADLFAGLAAYSRNSYHRYEEWNRQSSPQLSLLEIGEPVEFSGSERYRYPVLHEFNNKCKQTKLGVSLKTDCGLRTHKPDNPINFWWYVPQHKGDRALVRSK